MGNVTAKSNAPTGRAAHFCTVRTTSVEFAASLGEARTNGATTGLCVFLTLLGHGIVLEDWGCFCCSSEIPRWGFISWDEGALCFQAGDSGG